MSLEKTAEQIKNMEIRGAGKIAREAAAALRDHAESLPKAGLSAFVSEMNRAADILLATRPTAVSLPNAVRITLAGLSSAETESEARALVKTQADRFVDASTKAVERIAEICASRISDGMTIMTHCNSKAALAGILLAKKQGKNISVIATEVRPWNQGLLTIKTLNDHEIPTTYIVDSAVRTFMKEADLVIVGADAVTVKGAVVNKIGTSQIALAAHEARKNVLVAAETYKFAPKTALGHHIEIEERPTSEVLSPETAAELPFVTVRNPVFDVTPPRYIDVIVTEAGAVPPEAAYTIMKEYLGFNPEQENP